MTDRELFGCFLGFERDEHGAPKLPSPIEQPKPLSEKEHYRLYLHYGCGITDPAKQREMWEKERARREERRRKKT